MVATSPIVPGGTVSDLRDRYRGALIGLATGDAIGTTLEFKRPGSFRPITGMVGGGPFNLNPGQWTDDTSMALCLAISLISVRRFDPIDQLERYVRWYRDGYLSSTGSCFDIGNTTRSALLEFERTREPFPGPTHRLMAGNGSIMRLAPVPMAFASSPVHAIGYSGESSRTTHGAAAAIDACRYLGGLVVGALTGASKAELVSARYSPIAGFWVTAPLMPEIDEVAAGSYQHRMPPEIEGSGYVVKSLEAALWAFYCTDTFAEGCLLAANLGDDADTTAAVYGQLAGAYYGASAIPEQWRERLVFRPTIEALADSLFAMSGVARSAA